MDSYAPRAWGYRVLGTLLVTVPMSGAEVSWVSPWDNARQTEEHLKKHPW